MRTFLIVLSLGFFTLPGQAQNMQEHAQEMTAKEESFKQRLKLILEELSEKCASRVEKFEGTPGQAQNMQEHAQEMTAKEESFEQRLKLTLEKLSEKCAPRVKPSERSIESGDATSDGTIVRKYYNGNTVKEYSNGTIEYYNERYAPLYPNGFAEYQTTDGIVVKQYVQRTVIELPDGRKATQYFFAGHKQRIEIMYPNKILVRMYPEDRVEKWYPNGRLDILYLGDRIERIEPYGRIFTTYLSKKGDHSMLQSFMIEDLEKENILEKLKELSNFQD